VVPPVKGDDDDKERPAVYLLAKGRDTDQEQAEEDRLLYVAATRAREKLIISGCVNLNKGGALSKPRGWLGQLAAPECLDLAAGGDTYNLEGTRAVHTTLQTGGTAVSCAIYEPGYALDVRLTESGPELEEDSPLPPPLLEPVLPRDEEVDAKVADQERIPPQRVWRVVPAVKRPRAPAWVLGSLVHEALAAWRFPEGDAPAASLGRFESWARARAREYGIADPDQLADAVRRSRQLLLRFHGHPLYGEMDGAARRLHEVPYSLEVDGRAESGIIDALYQLDGGWTIVEFKTDRVRDGAELQALLAEEGYAAQAGRYQAAARRLLGESPRCLLCMLNFGGTVHVYEPGGEAG
jgi:ATP-dependent exoDNAse (exonuclease V) beta subunit